MKITIYILEHIEPTKEGIDESDARFSWKQGVEMFDSLVQKMLEYVDSEQLDDALNGFLKSCKYVFVTLSSYVRFCSVTVVSLKSTVLKIVL